MSFLGASGNGQGRRIVASTALVVMGVVLGAGPTVTAAASPGDKITLCHATGSVRNPYVEISPDPASIVKGKGHGGHAGPVFDPDGGKGQPRWGDIIPAFDYPGWGKSPAGHFDGLNVPAGQSLLDNSCHFPRPAQLTLVKKVVNDNGGTAVAKDWTLGAAGPTPLSGRGGASSAVKAGTYTLSESDGPAGYTPSAWSCPNKTVVAGAVTMARGDVVTCTITNTDQPAHLTLVKLVDNSLGGTALPTDWTLFAAGPTPLSGPGGASGVVMAGTYELSESVGPPNYTASKWSCPGKKVTASAVTLDPGDSVTCTIINTDPPVVTPVVPPSPAHLTLIKKVVNGHGGTAIATDWTLSAIGPVTITGTSGSAAITGAAIPAGGYALSEAAGPTGYTGAAWTCVGGTLNGRTVTLASAQLATCTLTNTENAPAANPVPPVPAPNPVQLAFAPAPNPVPPVPAPNPVPPVPAGSAMPLVLTAVPNAAASPVLAFTGAELVPMGLLGLIALALGAGLMVAARRRASD